MTGIVVAPTTAGGVLVVPSNTGSPGAPGATGAPGSNVMAIGLFTAASGLTISTGTDLVQTSGYSTSGKGHALYVYDAAVDAAWVTAHPGAGFVTANSRGFRISLQQRVNAAMFGALFDNSTDDTTAIQRAINHLNTMGGGELWFPSGIGKHAGLTFKNKVQYRGAGRDTASTSGTVLLYTGTGDGVVISNPINSSTAANISVEGITFKNANRNSGKGCFADTGSTDLKFRHCAFVGSDRGLILDQSELVDVSECDFEGVASQTTLAWLVNGADRNVGASGSFTNRISFQRCQFNGQTGTTLIADDGGADHSYVDNNYNGGATHIRAAAVEGLSIVRGEFESATAASIILQTTRLGGGAGGSSSPVHLDRPFIVPGGTGQNCVTCFAVGQLIINAPFLGNTTAVKIAGTANVNGIYAMGIHNGGGGANFDGFATNHWEVGSGGTINTNLTRTVATGKQFVFDDVSGTTFQSYQEHVVASPFRYHSVVSKGGSGWQGGWRVQLNYNAGSLFDALLIMANTDGTTATNRFAGAIQVPQLAAGNVVTPPSGYQSLFIDSTDGKLKRMDSSRTVVIIN